MNILFCICNIRKQKVLLIYVVTMKYNKSYTFSVMVILCIIMWKAVSKWENFVGNCTPYSKDESLYTFRILLQIIQTVAGSIMHLKYGMELRRVPSSWSIVDCCPKLYCFFFL